MLGELEVTNNWFEQKARQIWDELIPKIKPKKVLEIGSFEGASACYLVHKIANEYPLELFCVDTWGGGDEHSHINMSEVERRFDRNMAKMIGAATNSVQLHKHKALSVDALAGLLADGHKGTFDLIYIDGSHHAPDVLVDATLSYELLKNMGWMIFDDYLWQSKRPGLTDPLSWPKAGIDAFCNVYAKRCTVAQAPLYQLYVQKTG